MSTSAKIDWSLLWDFIKKSPAAAPVFIFSYFSGQIWIYLLVAYYKQKKRGDYILNRWSAKVALGLLWFALVGLFYQLIINNSLCPTHEQLLEMVAPVLVIGLAVQAIIFIFMVGYNCRGKG